MPKVPRVSGAEAIRALQRLGFEQARQNGSHVVMRRGGSGCVVPMHRSRRLALLPVCFGRPKYLSKNSLRICETDA